MAFSPSEFNNFGDGGRSDIIRDGSGAGLLHELFANLAILEKIGAWKARVKARKDQRRQQGHSKQTEDPNQSIKQPERRVPARVA